MSSQLEHRKQIRKKQARADSRLFRTLFFPGLNEARNLASLYTVSFTLQRTASKLSKSAFGGINELLAKDNSELHELCMPMYDEIRIATRRTLKNRNFSKIC